MTQEQALNILKTGANVFLTGEPGAGKTYTLNRYLAHLDACGVSVAITASTGIAATHVSGMTIHAWSGIGARDSLSEQDIDLILQKEKYVKRMRKANVLVIDEISMLAAGAFNAVETLCRRARGIGEPFGGMQVIVVGDFFQLPPITPYGQLPQFAFEAPAWQRANMLTCYLEEQHRQEDELLLGLLSSIRRAEIEEEHFTLLSEQTDISYEGVEPTRLFTHNKDVDALNHAELAKLSGPKKRYTMRGTGAKPIVEGLMKTCLSPQTLDLAVDAMVMCTKNNFEAGYVNGTLGRIVEFAKGDSFPIIETADGTRIKIEPTTWTMQEDGKVRAEIAQIPLRLAWAITIHKSQGMSLDAAEIDLRNAFTYGQGYVALSRVRTLAGMKIIGVGPNALIVDPRIVAADAKFRSASDEAVTAFENVDDEELEDLTKLFVERIGGKYKKGGEDVPRAAKAPKEPTVPTEEITRTHYEAGKTLAEIARARELTITTVWGHLEKLVRDGVVVEQALDERVTGGDSWVDIYTIIEPAIHEHGADKLKPIYEALNEAYPYEVIRIARAVYTRKVTTDAQNTQ
ncbi:hypothetical protein A3C87_01535 [Candidatus Kaiserbacteria bacterium RIFCSPHIGHO2_02_FULL_49_34]|uniref:AAA+ ATPase domain-containing protein n=1 Tax=Candidatus Kaiserbacteria bacterium RIFCSPHIGHO2_02_FULL_49_34 TaxID=1798491 RepID=A0A1F6DIW2_9BACT|nr:MAG: hypothetical protein A3C87_01535 [Candidatus Kaiserbacteria bacterium RIFCSPHIGHO2_02_FULL_49_34]